MANELISIVSPVHNEEEVIEEFVTRIKSALQDLNWELLLVDDGSTDGSYEVIARLAADDARIRPIKLSRNFGHQPAITCGIENANGDAVVILDADLQDPPEVINEFISKWREGYEVVYGKRNTRKGESFFKRVSAASFYRLLNRISDTKLPVDTGDFRLIDRKVVNALNLMNEKNRYVRGMVAWIGFNQTPVLYDRDPRKAGKTKFNFFKIISFGTDGLFSFSTKPLKIANWISIFFTLVTIFLGVYFTYQKIFYPERSLPGFVPIVLLISLISSVQFFVIGIIGSYVGRIYSEVKNRPIYIEDNN